MSEFQKLLDTELVRNIRFVIWEDSTSYDANQIVANIPSAFSDINSQYAIIYHNQDKSADGSKEKNHWQGLLKFKNNRSVRNIYKLLGTSSEVLPLGTFDNFDESLCYLVHRNKNCADKYQYPIEDLICSEGLQSHLLQYLKHRDSSESRLASEERDSAGAYQIYRFLIDNHVYDLQVALDFVFSNNLWSMWRRGYASFNALLTSNSKQLVSKLKSENKSLLDENDKISSELNKTLRYLKSINEYENFIKNSE